MCRVFEDLIDDIREGGNDLYAYKKFERYSRKGMGQPIYFAGKDL